MSEERKELQVVQGAEALAKPPEPERALAQEIAPGLAKRISQAMGTLRPLVLDGHVPQLNYRYPTIAQVREKANEALAKAGITLIPSIIRVGRGTRPSPSGKTITVTAVELEITIASEEGSYKVHWIGESEDVSDKGIPKAVSAAMKSFLATFLLAPVAEEEETPPASTEAPQAQEAIPEPQPHWIDDPEQRRKFWGLARGKLQLSPEKVHELLGVSHMRDYKGTLEEALRELAEKLHEERKKNAAKLSPQERAELKEMVWGGEA